MVRTLIEEAKRIPEPPPLPTDYSGLLDELRRWVEAAEAANLEVDAAIQVGCCWGAGILLGGVPRWRAAG